MMSGALYKLSFMLLPAICVQAAEPETRATFGVVAGDLTPALRVYTGVEQGVMVRSVWPGSPAEQAGVKRGDVVVKLDGIAVADRDAMAAYLLKLAPGDSVTATLSFGGQLREVSVKLLPRPNHAPGASSTAEAAVGGDRLHRPMVVSDDIRRQFRERRRNICAHFATLPHAFDTGKVTEELQAIRDLARDSNPGGVGWMVGRAGVAAVQFRDDAGTLLLRGADKKLTLEVFDKEGKLVQRIGLNSPAERAAIPPELLIRLKAL